MGGGLRGGGLTGVVDQVFLGVAQLNQLQIKCPIAQKNVRTLVSVVVCYI